MLLSYTIHAMQIKKLNLGCGSDIRKGWINLDSTALAGVDVVHDIEKLPLPFSNEEFDEILAQDVLEHMTDYVPVLHDLHRILKKGGTLTIRVPHFTSKNNYIDPTHRRLFSVSTFEFFVKNSALRKERDYYFDFAFERIALRRFTFEKSSRLFFYNRFTEWFFNLSPRLQTFYESTGLSREFPAENIVIQLIK